MTWPAHLNESTRQTLGRTFYARGPAIMRKAPRHLNEGHSLSISQSPCASGTAEWDPWGKGIFKALQPLLDNQNIPGALFMKQSTDILVKGVLESLPKPQPQRHPHIIQLLQTKLRKPHIMPLHNQKLLLQLRHRTPDKRNRCHHSPPVTFSWRHFRL
jgi:hypothetical protein